MVFYNGVRMDLLNINSLARDAVYSPDGVDYLYTHFLVDVTCFVHNAYLSDDRLFKFRDHVGADRVLRALLLQPRRKLKITFETGGAAYSKVEPGRNEDSFAASDASNPFVQRGPYPYMDEMGLNDAQFARDNNFPPYMDGSGIDANPHISGDPRGAPGGQLVNEQTDSEEVLYLESPYGGAANDDKDGPLPIDCTVTSVIGENGFVVSWRCETWLNECSTSLGITSADQIALASNRFTMVHDVDENYNTVRTVQGVAVFRMSVIDRLGVNPDALRNQLLLPVPPAFQRRHIQVRQSSDGTAVAYLIEDAQTPVVFTPGADTSAVRMEVSKRQMMGNQHDLFGSILEGTQRFFQNRLNQKWLNERTTEPPTPVPVVSPPPSGGGGGGGGGVPANTGRPGIFPYGTRQPPAPPAPPSTHPLRIAGGG